MIRCRRCNSELTKHARFCNVCGLFLSTPEGKLERSTPFEKKISTSHHIFHCINCASELPKEAHFCVVCGTTQASKNDSSTVNLQPSMSLKPVRSIRPVNKQYLNETDNMVNRPDPHKPSRSIIPSRPDTGKQTIAPNQSKLIPRAPAYQVPVPPTNVPPSLAHQTQQNSSSSKLLSGTRNQHQQQLADPAMQQNQIYTQSNVKGNIVQRRPQEQNNQVQIPSGAPSRQKLSSYNRDEQPATNFSTQYTEGKNGKAGFQEMPMLSTASFTATSKAAEHWRKSWRDRQHAEAGPAENASRGQASVPTPLTKMQQSFARIRAIKKTSHKEGNDSVKFGSWIILFLMICLIFGLGSYIIVSYLPNSPFGETPSTSSTHIIQPTLSAVGSASQTVQLGHSIQLHGAQFGANQIITFLHDTAIPIVNTSGNQISIRTDSAGAFYATIFIDSKWTTGSHTIEAIDKDSNKTALLIIQVIPVGTPTTTSPDLSVAVDGKSTTFLTFKAVNGQGNPDSQRITITNTSGANLQWSAMASSNNNLNWLMMNGNDTFGELSISQQHSISISVNTTGLKSTLKNPYAGQIIFTINNNQQLTLPVQLQIVEATPEMVVSPNPIIAKVGPGNTCQPDVTLTLINLGTATISWTVNPDNKANIQFISNGKPLEAGILLPSGVPGDTITLNLKCNSIQVGGHYHVSVYANQLYWSNSVIVQ